MSLCEPFEHHCFISYSTRNGEGAAAKAFAERLDVEVRGVASHIRLVWVDVFHMDNRGDLRTALMQGINKSICLIGMVSPLYLTSEWCEFEWREMANQAPDCVAPLIWKHVSNFSNPTFLPLLAQDVALRRPLTYPEHSRLGGQHKASPPDPLEWVKLAEDVVEFIDRCEKLRCPQER